MLFADLSGYTALADRLDHEEVKAVVDYTLDRLADEIARYGGRVDKFIGDNVMAVFGAPVSHEDDPERAVRAGLAMQGAMVAVNRQIADRAGGDLTLRIGINSGEVLAGRIGDSYTVIGDSVNVASRLENAAAPGTVTVGESTWKLTRDSIEYEELDPITLKGKPNPVPAYRALAAKATGGHVLSRPALPLIGRDSELALLGDLFEKCAIERRPYLTTLIGSAGIGKSRLIAEFISRISLDSRHPTIRVGRCPAYASGSAYRPIAEMVRSQFSIQENDDPNLAWRKLHDGISSLFSEVPTKESPGRVAALIAATLGIEPGVDADLAEGIQAGNGADIRELVYAPVRALLEALSHRAPVVIAIEDLQWADEGTLDLVEFLSRWFQGSLLIVAAARDELLERRAAWGVGRRRSVLVPIEPVAEAEIVSILEAIAGQGNAELGPEVITELASRSAGNPLFAGEMVNHLLSGDPSGPGDLPATVEAVIAARLDSLDPAERRLLQHASVVGNRFWEGALADLADQDGFDLFRTLVSLEEKDIIRPSSESRLAGERAYSFKHALMQEVAYARLPKSERSKKHEQVGDYIADQSRGSSRMFDSLCAHHFSRAVDLGKETARPDAELAGLREKAIAALERAGDSAAAVHSNGDAVRHYEEAVRLAADGSLPTGDIPEKLGDVELRLGHSERAIELWTGCGDDMADGAVTRRAELLRKIGAAHWQTGSRDRAIEHYQEGIDLLKDEPPSPELIQLYGEVANLYMHTGENMLATYAAENALRIADSLGERVAASRALGIVGRVHGRMGNLDQAGRSLERSVDLARASGGAEVVRALITHAAHLETVEEDLDRAAEVFAEAHDAAREFGLIPAQIEICSGLARIAVRRGDHARVREWATLGAALAQREGLSELSFYSDLPEAWLLWRAGTAQEAIRRLESAVDSGRAAGRAEMVFPALMIQARIRSGEGDYRLAHETLEEAAELCERANLRSQLVECRHAQAVNRFDAGGEGLGVAVEAVREAAARCQSTIGTACLAEAEALLLDDPVAGASELEKAGELWDLMRWPFAAARARLLAARRLAEVDPERGYRALGESRRELDDLGAKPLMREAERRMQQLAGAGVGRS